MNIKHVYMGWSPAATLVAVVMMGAMNVFAQPYTPEAGKGSVPHIDIFLDSERVLRWEGN
jgi:hypothetical protein